jgi:hypothetical protein
VQHLAWECRLQGGLKPHQAAKMARRAPVELWGASQRKIWWKAAFFNLSIENPEGLAACVQFGMIE